MPNILITGANRGIGLELCKQYAADGWRVFACCRQPVDATELNALVSQYPDISCHALDVSIPEQITRLSKALANETIDVLFNNAGVYGGSGNQFGDFDTEQWLEVFKVNTIAPALMAEAFVHQVARSDLKVIAILSSKVGSIEDNGYGCNYMYRSSKTAVNQVVKNLSIELQERGVISLALHPGWVLTDMGGPNAWIDVQTSVKGLKQVISSASQAQSGHFFAYDGQEIPW